MRPLSRTAPALAYLALALSQGLCLSASAESRRALVLGNNTYLHARALANPVNDAEAMAGLLRRIGFEKSGVLMARTETRVRDFRAFATASDYVQSGGAHLFSVKEKAEGGFTTEWVHHASAGWEKPGFEQSADHPVVCVSWEEASAFCRWLSEKEGLVYRLPRKSGSSRCFSLHSRGKAVI